jgi:hypothetical protein
MMLYIQSGVTRVKSIQLSIRNLLSSHYRVALLRCSSQTLHILVCECKWSLMVSFMLRPKLLYRVKWLGAPLSRSGHDGEVNISAREFNQCRLARIVML